MGSKNKLDSFNQYDNLDKMLFDYYSKKTNDIPLSTQNAIKNAFQSKSKKSNTTIYLKKVVLFFISIGIITVTTVYAQDIVNFITNIFTNTTPGIEKAIENGYLQNVDMDFIRYNNIGVKVDYMIMDEKNLDISFICKYYGLANTFDSIALDNISIIDENNNVLFCFSENSLANDTNINLINTTATFNNRDSSTDDMTTRFSLLINSDKFPNSKILTINVSRVTLKCNNSFTHIDGNWNFSINLDDKFIARNSFEYSYNTDSSYVTSLKNYLNETSLTLEINLNTIVNSGLYLRPSNIILLDNNNISYNYTKVNIKDNSFANTPCTTITLTYPISLYDNIQQLHLYINLGTEEKVCIDFFK